MAGEAIPSLTRIENEHFPTSAYQLQRGREPSVASADNDHVVDGSTHFVVDACLPCDARAGGRQRRGAERHELAPLRRLTPLMLVSCAFHPGIVQAVDEIRLTRQKA